MHPLFCWRMCFFAVPNLVFPNKTEKGDKTVLDFVPFMIAVYLIVFALRVFLLWGKCEPFIFDPNALLPRLFSQAGPR